MNTATLLLQAATRNPGERGEPVPFVGKDREITCDDAPDPLARAQRVDHSWYSLAMPATASS